MLGTVTDSSGDFLLSDVPPGWHHLVVSMLGYEQAARDTLIRPGDNFRIDLPARTACGRDGRHYRQRTAGP